MDIGADEAGGVGAAAAAAGGGSGGGAAPGRPVVMLAKARGADPARGADGDLPLLLAAGPVSEALLRLVGSRGLDALMATRCALQRKARELAADVAWRVGKIWIRPGRVAAFAVRFPSARALTMNMRGMTPALAIRVATAAGGMRRLETLSLRSCRIGSEGAKAQVAALTAASAAGAAALARALPACATLAPRAQPRWSRHCRRARSWPS